MSQAQFMPLSEVEELVKEEDPADSVEMFLAQSRAGERLTQHGPPEQPNFVLHDADLVREVLGRRVKEFPGEPHGYASLDRAYTDAGREVLMRPRLAEGEFLSPMLRYFRDIFHEAANEWESSHREQGMVDMLPECHRLSALLMAKTLFGYDLTKQAGDFLAASLNYEDIQGLRGEAPQLAHDPEWRAMGEFVSRSHKKLMGDVLFSRCPMLEDQEKAKMSDAMVPTFLNAYAGAGTMMSWLTLLLAEYAQVQNKLREEVRALEETKLYASSTLDTLSYAGNVIMEALRFRPVAWLIGRRAAEDVQLAGLHIPKGSSLTVCTYSLHRDSRYWDSPDEFIPERWQHGKPAKHPFAFLPFGAGQHKCVGKRFAVTTLTLWVALLLRRFEIDLVDSVRARPLPRVGLRPHPGAFVKLSEI